MASTYTLISSQVLASSASTVTFSSIPATYTDLVLRVSARDNDTGAFQQLRITFNGDTATNYSYTNLYGTGSSAFSIGPATANFNYINFQSSDSNGATANSFGSSELYIPSYTVSQNKPVSMFSVSETNATATNMGATAGLWRNTAAITSLTMVPAFTSGNFLTGSSFYLYGIKNS